MPMPPRDTPCVNIIGGGKVGKSLAALLHKHYAAHINGVINSSYQHALTAVQFIQAGAAYANINELPPADIYFITTPDDAIQATCDKLASSNKLTEKSIVIHCSGSLTSDILNSAKLKNCYTASIHPVRSFANPEECVNNFSGTICTLEGDSEIIPQLQHMFKKIGATLIPIHKTAKNIYHVGCVLANNYLVTLHYTAVQCYLAAGIDEQTANNLASTLMQQGLDNLQNLPHQQALTGPIQRGDVRVVEKHLDVLADYPVIRDIYVALGRGAVMIRDISQEK